MPYFFNFKNKVMKNKVILRFIIPPALIIAFVIYVIISLSTKNSSPPSQSGWVLQMNLSTYLNGRTVNDMTFLDSLTGFAVSSNKFSGDTGYIFKTTNGGDNWFVNFMPFKNFSKIIFVNDSIGFACGGSGGGTSYFCKTTNKGISWTGSNYGASNFKGMSVLNKDTIYLCDPDVLTGGVFRSTNGGQNWQHLTSGEPHNIYMYNSKIGYYSDGYLKKTTDGGYNWTQINNKGFRDIHFFDSLVGYRVCSDSTGYGRVHKTIDGGNNWIIQSIPIVTGASTWNDLIKFYFQGRDTIWAIGSYIWYSNPLRYYGLIYKTTNGGLNWGYQLPDTHLIQIKRYNVISFIGNKYGWVYDGNYNNGIGMGVHTTIDGDTTIYMDINKNTTSVSNDFILYQNYPNPFNSMTNVKVQMLKQGFVEIKVFDLTGKLIKVLIKQNFNSGEHNFKFNLSDFTSGVYFYSLFADGVRIDTKKLMLIK
jgi:photosystem II stability/assembly factor-like uncharacterized protein